MSEGSGTTTNAGGGVVDDDAPGLLRSPGMRWLRSHRLVVEAAATVPMAALLFILYQHLTATWPFNSDLGFLPIQANDVLHGNPTVHGWVGPQDTYLLTELPVYVVAVAVGGLSPTVVNVVSAGFYTLTTLAVAALARVGLRRRDQPLAMLVAFGLVAAPAYPHGVGVLIPGPGHMGTMLFVLSAMLCLHASHRRARVVLSLLALLLLTLSVASDPLALYTGALPIALVHGLRLAGRLPQGALDDGPALAVGVLGGLLGALLGRELPALIGYHLFPVASVFAPLSAIPTHIAVTLNSWLPVFGAQFFNQPLTPLTGWQLFRFLGYAFTVAACGVVVVQSTRALGRPVARGAAEPLVLSQTLLAVVVCDLGALIFSTNSASGDDGRYLIPAVLAGAALAGRTAPAMLSRFRWRAVAAAVCICYIALLPLSLRYPAAPLPDQRLVTWLETRHLHHGLAEYWSAGVVTAESGGKVQIRGVANVNGKLGPYLWVVNTSWYGSEAYANFVVIDSRPGTGITPAAATKAFGRPEYEDRVGRFTVMVWNHNVLPELGPAWPPLNS